jgi:hypothetical protein
MEGKYENEKGRAVFEPDDGSGAFSDGDGTDGKCGRNNHRHAGTGENYQRMAGKP